MFVDVQIRTTNTDRKLRLRNSEQGRKFGLGLAINIVQVETRSLLLLAHLMGHNCWGFTDRYLSTQYPLWNERVGAFPEPSSWL